MRKTVRTMGWMLCLLAAAVLTGTAKAAPDILEPSEEETEVIKEEEIEVTEEPEYCEITWMYEDGTVIDVTKAEYGKVPSHANPEKTPTDEYFFEFTVWEPQLREVTGPAEYQAKFRPVKRSYEITWKNDDGSVIDVTKEEYGTVPEHARAEKKPTGDYTYEFAGWDREITAVIGPAEYTARFTAKKIESSSQTTEEDKPTEHQAVNGNTGEAEVKPTQSKVKRTYKITWKYEDGKKIDVTTVEEGAVPKHAAPFMEPTAEYTYEFIGWDRTPAAVTGPATYTAMFRRIKNIYSVSFDPNNGTSVAVLTAEYGDFVKKPEDPVKEGFTFKGWYMDEALSREFNFYDPVTANITVYAKWEEDAKTSTDIPDTTDVSDDPQAAPASGIKTDPVPEGKNDTAPEGKAAPAPETKTEPVSQTAVEPSSGSSAAKIIVVSLAALGAFLLGGAVTVYLRKKA